MVSGEVEPAASSDEGIHEKRGDAVRFAGLAAGGLACKIVCQFMLGIPAAPPVLLAPSAAPAPAGPGFGQAHYLAHQKAGGVFLAGQVVGYRFGVGGDGIGYGGFNRAGVTDLPQAAPGDDGRRRVAGGVHFVQGRFGQGGGQGAGGD